MLALSLFQSQDETGGIHDPTTQSGHPDSAGPSLAQPSRDRPEADDRAEEFHDVLGGEQLLGDQTTTERRKAVGAFRSEAMFANALAPGLPV